MSAPTAAHDRAFDIILFGATGFTGRLVADYLAQHADRPRWAIAGRNRDKLAALGFDVPIIVADALDPNAMGAVATQARVVCTTVGPFGKYGSALVAACANAGTHYCDLTAEVPWMRAMIDQHGGRAAATGARIVHACGFDSIPSDLGTFLIQAEMVTRFGHPATHVTAFYGESSGGFSGGTAASAIEIARASSDRAVRRLIANPFGLDPDPNAPHAPSPDEARIGWDPGLRMFTIPFIMAFSNSRIVRRAHALSGFPWGPDFVYREVMTLPGNARGLAMATGITAGLAAFALAMRKPRLREFIATKLPQPGEGPSLEARTKGHWKLRLVATRGRDRLVYIASDRADPGYSSTAKMLGESALCLAHDALTSAPGFSTPSVAMGHALANRLRRAGLTLTPAD